MKIVAKLYVTFMTTALLLVSATALGAPAPRFAYIVNSEDNTLSIYTVNATTGQLRHNGYVRTGLFPVSVAVDPMGRFAYVANARGAGTGMGSVSTYLINPDNGTLTSVGLPVPTEFLPLSITVDPLGLFAYVGNYLSNSISIYRINPGGTLTSAGTVVAGPSSRAYPASVAIDPTNRFAYVADLQNGALTRWFASAT